MSAFWASAGERFGITGKQAVIIGGAFLLIVAAFVVWAVVDASSRTCAEIDTERRDMFSKWDGSLPEEKWDDHARLYDEAQEMGCEWGSPA